jgi:hypothetical protein
LGIGWIAAYSSQAKGRVERSFLTDQDRLIKQLRLAKANTMQEANEFLEKEYWPEWNAKFARPARSQEDLHCPLTEGFELGSALSHVEQRIITNNYTFPYYNRQYHRSRGCATGDEAPELACGTVAEWRVEGTLSRPLCRD